MNRKLFRPVLLLIGIATVVRAEPGDSKQVGAAGAWNDAVAVAVANHLIYTIEKNGGLFEANPVTGARTQIGRTEYRDAKLLFAVGRALCIVDADGSFYEFRDDGSRLLLGKPGVWKGTQTGAVLGDHLYTTEAGGRIRDTTIGPQKWSWKATKANLAAIKFLVAAADELYGIDADGKLVQIGKADGAQTAVGKPGQWKGVLAAAALNGRLYTTEHDGGLYQTELNSGVRNRIGRPDFGATVLMFPVGDRIYTIDADGTMHTVQVASAHTGGPYTATARWKYTFEVTGWKQVAGTYRVDVGTTEYEATEWFFWAPVAPESGRQSDPRTTMDPPGKPGYDLSPEHRPILFAEVPVKDPKPGQGCSVAVRYEATLFARRLIAVPPGQRAIAVPLLTEEERTTYLAPTSILDFESDAFQKWLDDHRLRRASSEDEVDFGRRVFQAMIGQYTYEIGNMKEHPQVSEECRQTKGRCETLSLVYAAAMRANGVPARVVCGLRDKPEKPNKDGALVGHVQAEFMIDGVGWVPVDLAFALSDKKRGPWAYFAADTGDLLVENIDYEHVLRNPRGGRSYVLYGMRFLPRALGKGKIDISGKPISWDVAIVKQSATIAPTAATR
ncbi:MAG TPA: transglutaminase domain-containing protein [Pirellulales bacterium]|nr:transglutaminase domain-containing protein [Pirellulales bacterium]